MIELYLDESMFEAGFSNLRKRIADSVPEGVIVTNVTKIAGSNNNCFLIKAFGKTYRVIDTGHNSVGMPGYFTSCSLSKATEKIIEVLSDIGFWRMSS